MSSRSLSTTCLKKLAQLGILRIYLKEEILQEICEQRPLDSQLRAKLLEDFKNKNNIKDDQALNSFALQNLLSVEDLQLLSARTLCIQGYIMDHFRGKAEAHFLQRKDALDQVIYSLIRVNQESLARELHLQIAEAESDFSTLASEHAQGPERQTRGVIGPAPLNQAHPALAQRLRGAKTGELLKPFQIEQWWVIVRLEQKIEASFDEATCQRMAAELFELWLRDAVEHRLQDLVKAAAQP